jgi:hypothetical protein
VRAILSAVLAVGVTALALVAPAVASTTGRESFEGTIVRDESDHVVSTLLVAKGVFTGSGRIVEVDNRPGDPENVTRDNLVFPQGTIHIRSANKRPTMSLNPKTCVITLRVQQTNHIEGGTRRFRHASGTFAGTVRARGVAARNPDGTCNQQAAPLLEVDLVSARGTLSY